MTATITQLCPCGSGLAVEDDGQCICCWFGSQPQMVRDIEPWIERHRARHAEQEAVDEAAG